MKGKKQLQKQGLSQVEITGTINNILPKGTIVIWKGNEIPSGWALCDGKNDTPNLTGKFVLGASNDSTIKINNTGGKSALELSQVSVPSMNHTHPFGINNSFTSTQFGTITLGTGCTQNGLISSNSFTATPVTNPQSQSYPFHTHLINYNSSTAKLIAASLDQLTAIKTIVSATNNIYIMPPYYALAYIMKL